jgi:ubiquinone biosynthesis protein
MGAGYMNPVSRMGTTFKDLNRLREILQVLVGHGFGFLVDQLQLGAYLPRRIRPKAAPVPKFSAPVRVRMVLESLGPVFIKLGQTLSMRPDMLPPEYLIELVKLQDRVPPIPQQEVRGLIEEELGISLEKAFKKFNPVPTAAASMAQVHWGMTPDGREVAVKIQRPGLKKIMDSDIEILRVLAKLWEKFSGQDLPRHPVEFVNEFERIMREELDFLAEGRHMERLAHDFKNRPEYSFPQVDWKRSTARCLTQDFIFGHKLTDLPANLPARDRRHLAQILIDAYILMALEDHFFHADPHPGNLLIDTQKRLVFLDAGQVGRLDTETVNAFTDMLLALIEQDTDALVEAYLRLSTTTENFDQRAMKKDVTIFLEQYYSLPVDKISFGQSLQDLIGISFKYSIELPPDFVVLARTFLGAEGLARGLNPSLNLVEAARPVAEKILRQRYHPRVIAKNLWRQAKSLERFVSNLPSQLHDLMHKLLQGELKIEFQHEGLENLQHSLDRASNRLSFSMIVAALVIGSSLLLTANRGPIWNHLSILGLLGFLIAGLLGLWLIVAILRSGRI